MKKLLFAIAIFTISFVNAQEKYKTTQLGNIAVVVKKGKSLFKAYVDNIYSAGTNIVILSIAEDTPINNLLSEWKGMGLLAVPFGKQKIRLVIHLEFTDDMLQRVKQIIS